ncbi:MAG: sugar nucleotide-binding protein [Ruminococcus flavefaciens]|nr:sugar nucleotide-binding protein [Ruminococcus flavefaciens]
MTNSRKIMFCDVDQKRTKQKYLIIGASSFIGRHLYRYCKKENIDVLGTYYSCPYNDEWIKFDLCTDSLRVVCKDYLDGVRPNAVIICSANTNIDDCKRDERASNYFNVFGTKRILEQAEQLGIKSVFLSSEAVFNGKRGLYTERDEPSPVTLYGKQKLQIEQYMAQNIKQFLIFRISRAVGGCFGEQDIFNEFYNKIINQEEIICLKNQSFCLTEVDDIAKCIINALINNINGLYHLSSANYISRCELACLYAEKVFGGYNKIIEKEYDEIAFLDNRHVYGGLRGDKLADLLGIQFMNIAEILDKYVSTYEGEKSGKFIEFK